MSEILKEDLEWIENLIKTNEGLANDELRTGEYIGALLTFYKDQEDFDYPRWLDLFSKFHDILEKANFSYRDKIFEVGTTLSFSIYLLRNELIEEAIYNEGKSFHHIGFEKSCIESGDRRDNIKVLELKDK